MTLKRFETLLQKISPKLHFRVRRTGDVVGLYAGTSYICRLGKGEIQANGYREAIINPENKIQYIEGNIKKRGRKTIINLLRNYRWVTKVKDRSMLLYGKET